MLWACIVLPQLALDTVLRDRDDPDTPLVLLGGPTQRRVLQSVNAAAAGLGLRAGQTLTAARALAEGFTCVESDPARIEQVQQMLAAWAYGYSAQVSLHYPRSLLLEVGSSLRLFGAWPTLQARLREQLNAQGLRQRIVLAANPVAARMLANAHDGLAATTPEQTHAAVAQLPIARSGLPEEVAQAFARMGLRHVQQLLELPREALARRFPASVQLHLDQLLGRRRLPLAFYQPPQCFEASLELNFDVESHQALLFPLRRLIGDLAVFLVGRDCGVQRLDLHLEHAEGQSTLLRVGLLSAERDAGLLFELTRGRLEALRIPAPVRKLRLQVDDLPRFVPSHQGLFDPRAAQAQSWQQLRERLRARLGDAAVNGLSVYADHRPEQAWRSVETEPGNAVGAMTGQRPGWLLADPQKLAPSTFTVLGQAERIESGWWDGGDVRRDYFRIETRDGLRGWAYQDIAQPGQLWLQGWFA
ncbi:Y-family DNA polymerase [Pseudomonas cremoricolorata]|uniref:DNA repair nucleotidyltransferase n=1 Tax=Pseudomonas cremoricolorata TaxID=157783 RepID=A0A089WX58_9PSED|nr:DNA polymerase Y family protein [Pseudomonas cremoricolorata]AIR91177.1 DNA repair nucleotidyltransferase [Pseudomonas cremoricolorata]